MTDIILDKDKCGFLLGAGASVEAQIPATYRLTKLLFNQVASDYPKLSRLLGSAIAGLNYQKAIRGENPFNDLNVEEVVSAVRLISERNSLEITPFVSAWHPEIEEMDRNSSDLRQGVQSAFSKFASGIERTIESAAKKSVEIAIKESKNNHSHFSSFVSHINGIDMNSLSGGAHNAAYTLSSVIGSQLKSYKGTGFSDLYTVMHALLVEIMWLNDSSSCDYLKPIIELSKVRNTKVFTLNYDNTIETCAAGTIQVFDGFTTGMFNGRWETSAPGIAIYKLHGSVTWLTDDTGNLTSLDKKPANKFLPTLIFGQREKLRDSGPFLDLLFEFKGRLAELSQLCIIGYSFADKHINKYLADWLKNGNRTAIIVNGPDFKTEEVFLKRFTDQTLNTKKYCGEFLSSI